MDIVVPLTLEAVRLVMRMLPQNYNLSPELLYDFFYKKKGHTYIYVPSSGDFYFAAEADLEDRQYVSLTVEEAREELFIRSLEN